MLFQTDDQTVPAKEKKQVLYHEFFFQKLFSLC